MNSIDLADKFERHERIINLTNPNIGSLFHLNYPHEMPEEADFTQHLIAPFGYNILLELHNVEFTNVECQDRNLFEVSVLHSKRGGGRWRFSLVLSSLLQIYDNYAGHNGTTWRLCIVHQEFKDSRSMEETNLDADYRNLIAYRDQDLDEGRTGRQKREILSSSVADDGQQSSSFSSSSSTPPSIYITSYLNTLHLRQRLTSKSRKSFNCTLRLQMGELKRFPKIGNRK